MSNEEPRSQDAIDRTIAVLRDNPRNESAWREMYLFYRRQVLGALYIFGVHDAGDRDDLCSEVFFRFLSKSPWSERWTTLPNGRVVGAYLRSIAHRLVLNAARRRAHLKKLDDPAFQTEPAVVQDEDDLQDLLRILTPDDRRFLERYIESGFSLRLVAVRERLTYSGAGTRLHRIRKKMQRFRRDGPG